MIGVLRAHGGPSAHVLDASDLIPVNREYADTSILPYWPRCPREPNACARRKTPQIGRRFGGRPARHRRRQASPASMRSLMRQRLTPLGGEDASGRGDVRS